MASHPAILTIDLAAIRKNYQALRHLMPAGQMAAVLKADAYGLGVAPVARTLWQAGCRLFFVATVAEGQQLRQALPEAAAEIGILNGLQPGDEADCARDRLFPVLNDLGQVERWGRFCGTLDQPLPAAVQVDTGMSRLGLPMAEQARFAASPFPGGPFPLRCIISHLACADDPADPLNRVQRDRFMTALRLFPAAPASLSASAGIFLGPDWHFDLARPGIALYGCVSGQTGAGPLRPVVRLQARVLQIQQVAAGATVGYGAAARVTAATRLATVAAGYADGYLRCLGNRSVVHAGRTALPVTGRVSMDMITVDAGAAPGLNPGDMLDLIGPERGVDALARDAGTIAHEILVALGPRYHRVYSEG